MATKKPLQPVKYMLLDLTTLEGTSCVRIVNHRQAQAYGVIMQAQGRKASAPPLLGRSFAKFDKLQLQYLHWSLFGTTPPEEYNTLVSECLAKLETEPMDDTSEEFLERQAAEVLAAAESAKDAAKPKAPSDPLARPAKETSTTGLVWKIADEQYRLAGNKMPDRKAVLDACAAEEINPSTAATQYAKWKKAKEAGSKETPAAP
jgi:hypothetical protein